MYFSSVFIAVIVFFQDSANGRVPWATLPKSLESTSNGINNNLEQELSDPDSSKNSRKIIFEETESKNLSSSALLILERNFLDSEAEQNQTLISCLTDINSLDYSFTQENESAGSNYERIGNNDSESESNKLHKSGFLHLNGDSSESSTVVISTEEVNNCSNVRLSSKCGVHCEKSGTSRRKSHYDNLSLDLCETKEAIKSDCDYDSSDSDAAPRNRARTSGSYESRDLAKQFSKSLTLSDSQLEFGSPSRSNTSLPSFADRNRGRKDFVDKAVPVIVGSTSVRTTSSNIQRSKAPVTTFGKSTSNELVQCSNEENLKHHLTPNFENLIEPQCVIALPGSPSRQAHINLDVDRRSKAPRRLPAVPRSSSSRSKSLCSSNSSSNSVDKYVNIVATNQSRLENDVTEEESEDDPASPPPPNCCYGRLKLSKSQGPLVTTVLGVSSSSRESRYRCHDNNNNNNISSNSQVGNLNSEINLQTPSLTNLWGQTQTISGPAVNIMARRIRPQIINNVERECIRNFTDPEIGTDSAASRDAILGQSSDALGSFNIENVQSSQSTNVTGNNNSLNIVGSTSNDFLLPDSQICSIRRFCPESLTCSDNTPIWLIFIAKKAIFLQIIYNSFLGFSK